MKKILISFLLVASASAFADGSINAVDHAPIGVMGDHMHKQGEWMLSYRYMRMNMEGNRIGDERVTARQIVGTRQQPGQFMVAPTKMPMDMHMLGMMYAPTDKITLMAMTNFLSNKMDHMTRMGGKFTTESSGMGDSKVSALISLYDQGHHHWHASLGLSLPTGSIDERDDTPVMKNAFLPYPMQLGSGTWDVLPAITYTAKTESLAWGAQLSGVLRTGTNDEGYTLGDRLAMTAWISHGFTDSISLSGRLKYQDWDSIDGANKALNPRMIQTANPALHAGQRLDALVGLNYAFTQGVLHGHRIGVEYGHAIDQDLDGPQLETDWTLTIGWQKAF